MMYRIRRRRFKFTTVQLPVFGSHTKRAIELALTASLTLWLTFIFPFFCLRHGTMLDMGMAHRHNPTRSRNLVILDDYLLEAAHKPNEAPAQRWQTSGCDVSSHDSQNRACSAVLASSSHPTSLHRRPLQIVPSLHTAQPIILPPITPPRAA